MFRQRPICLNYRANEADRDAVAFL